MVTISNKVCDSETGETTDCHREGINGRCGLKCPVLLAGYCEVEEVMYEGRAKMKDFNWYCSTCDEYLENKEVTFEETHDPKCGGCGNPVQGPEDPNDGPYDTLEEKNL